MRNFLAFSLILSAFTVHAANETIVAGIQAVEQNNLGPIVECTDPPVPSRIADVIQAPVTRNAGGCQNGLPAGTHRLMTRQNGFRSGNFLMRNLGNNKYAAVLNLDFQPATSQNTHRTATAAEVESMRARTINCLREMRPYYFGPGNQELDIQILTPEDKNRLPHGIPMPAKNVIKVTPERSDYRGNAGEYGTNFQCHTIGHEILHLLGLCDEYHEGIKPDGGNNYLDWRCRPVTATNSYMRNIWYAFRSTLPLTSRCTCNEECQKIMRQPEDVKRMFLGMDAEDFINSESHMMTRQIVSMNGTTPVYREPLCTRAWGQNVQPGQRPPEMKAFVFQSQQNDVYTFTNYRPRFQSGENGQLFFTKEDFTCDCRNEPQGYCRRIMEEFKRRADEYHPRVTCPLPSTPLNGDQGPSIGQQPGHSQSGMDCDSNNNCQLIVTSPGNGKSLLRQQHFQRILSGNCRGGAASNYERCEEYSYMGKNPAKSDYHMRLPEQPGNQCTQVLPQCLDDRIYLDGAAWNSSATSQ